MSKKEKKEKAEKVEKTNKKEAKSNNKPKVKSSYQKTKLGMKIAGYFMALIMIAGVIFSIVGMFIGA